MISVLQTRFGFRVVCEKINCEQKLAPNVNLLSPLAVVAGGGLRGKTGDRRINKLLLQIPYVRIAHAIIFIFGYFAIFRFIG